MAIYRPPKARWPLAVATGVLGILCGLLIGLAIGSQDPDPLEAGQEVRAGLLSASGSLEVAVIEYEEAVGPEGVESEAEYDGARDAVASSRARYAEVRPALAAIVPGLAERIDELYDRCSALVEDVAAVAEVDECAGELTEVLEAQG
jgi:hypothetical protein